MNTLGKTGTAFALRINVRGEYELKIRDDVRSYVLYFADVRDFTTNVLAFGEQLKRTPQIESMLGNGGDHSESFDFVFLHFYKILTEREEWKTIMDIITYGKEYRGFVGYETKEDHQ